jgi:hypothetical protein
MIPSMPDGKLFGKYMGFVRATNDPKRRGRVRAYCPAVMGSEDSARMWLDWAEPCLPWLGGLSNLDFGVPPIPSDNDKISIGVWIEFQAGNVEHPIWSGVFPYETASFGGHSKIDDASAAAVSGGSIMSAVEDGTISGDASDFSPVKPGKKEVRLIAKAETDIVLMSDRGGCIVIGTSGVHIQGTFITANGRTIDADLGNIVA